MKIKQITTFLAAGMVVASVAAFSTPASAGGVLGDIIEGACGGCGAGRALDQAHTQMGRPLDHVGAAAASAYGVPMSPYCATPAGVGVTNWQPVNTPCSVNGYYGVTVQF
jgi:hypothetical protein